MVVKPIGISEIPGVPHFQVRNVSFREGTSQDPVKMCIASLILTKMGPMSPMTPAGRVPAGICFHATHPQGEAGAKKPNPLPPLKLNIDIQNDTIFQRKDMFRSIMFGIYVQFSGLCVYFDLKKTVPKPNMKHPCSNRKWQESQEK